MEQTIIEHVTSKGAVKAQTVASVDKEALIHEYNGYLIQRMVAAHPHPTFKKYLAGRGLGHLCDIYDILSYQVGISIPYCHFDLSGSIGYIGNIFGNRMSAWSLPVLDRGNSQPS
jgi:hypothetical protein